MPISVNISTKREHFIYFGEKKKEKVRQKAEKEINSFLQSVSSVKIETAGNGLRQLKLLWSIPLHSIGSIVAVAFYMKNMVQSGPLNLFSVHIRS